MKFNQICWLREVVITDHRGQDRVALEFSCDTGYARTPHFFPITAEDLPQALALYREWGGNRPEGYRTGTTVKGPGVLPAPSIKFWRQYGNH